MDRRSWAVTALCLATVVLSGCSSADEIAIERASEGARRRAHAAQDSVSALLAGEYRPPDDATLVAKAIESLASGDGVGHVFASRSPAAGQVELDVGFQQTGRGGPIAQVTMQVRLCVRISGALGGPAAMTDVACQPYEETRDPGRPDKIIMLED